jgi:hypothetical protein
LLNTTPNAGHAKLFWLALRCLFRNTSFHLGQLRSFWRHLHRLSYCSFWSRRALCALYVYRTLNGL